MAIATLDSLSSWRFSAESLIIQKCFLVCSRFFYDPSLQENFFARQELAGKILYRVMPKCPLNIDGALYATPGLLEVSVKELPWYFCANFGKDQVRDFITDLISELGNEKLTEKYKTMLFWVKMYGE
ncbi:hypothetical protein [Pleionea litopenaei]|uniref:Uncharacterized protein n=1 Tax=Pleionea litopenaei TaxID=3070815 RepID=A0AA51X852_9GAMM|nr:hypothetical protein [Pleionea sp. HL-JVS1]WMS89017.1 hypothetical protein Q9312_08895 [Pleionea sp. HL-JVS1]